MKKVLITAGSTWMKIDDVRVITNIFTGNTGVFIAKEMAKRGIAVTLLLNPARVLKTPVSNNLKVMPFFYYHELKDLLMDVLKNEKFDLIIHTAAVSDYRVKGKCTGKIASGVKDMTLELLPVGKLIKTIRKECGDALLVQFKLETDDKTICDTAHDSLLKNKSDYVVANVLNDVLSDYKANIIDKYKKIVSINSKKELVVKLIDLIR
ncbi:MAG: phosphopantothenoylcysteine decarboxylase [Candidatus Omnitrophica bacterium]|nr:phosphopantothenoylcysteine decarboxylase [Candidatus Omnitrophota bacterium]